MTVQGGSRRIDRILHPQYADGLAAMSLDDLRSRRDECLAEREYLSLLRRLVQGRAEILKAEVERRGGTGQGGTLVERLSKVLSTEGHGSSRGEAVKVGLPEEEMLQVWRRVERLVMDAGLSDPTALDDRQLSGAVDVLEAKEQEVSRDRSAVIDVLDRVQEELKRRYKEDPSLVLS